mmetsp:Transcript_243/g.794  ORF Transcript_243/g.794 Transcript_243/m.794 type:complete len:488 (+) Transcript_243:67-1530(+)
MSRFFSRMRSKMSEHPSADSLDILEQQPPHQQLLQRLESFPTLSEPGDALQFVQLPPETVLVASVCWNPNFRPNSIFVPVTASADAPEVTGLYEVPLRRNDGDAAREDRGAQGYRPRGDPAALSEACPVSDRTDAPPPLLKARKVCSLPPEGYYYGSKITSAGTCYLCCANRSLILKVELGPDAGSGGNARREASVFTFLNQASNVQPSDVAIDERSGVLYVACYEKAYNALTAEGEVLNTLRTHAQKKGLVYRIPLATRIPQLFADRLSQVAGCNICYDDDALWVSELTNLVRIPLHPTDATPTSQWTRVAPFDPTLLAHNISIDQAGRRILFPYFRRVNVATSIVLQHSGIAWFLLGLFGMAYTFVMSKLEPIIMLQRLRFLFCGCLRRSRQEAEAEEAITSLTAKIEEGAQGVFTSVDGRGAFSVVCFGMYSYKTGSMQSLRVEHEHWQNGHCMHVEKAGRYLVFINYDKRELMVVEAEGALSP